MHLIAGMRGVHCARGRREVTYVHLMFDAHQVIFAEGVASESFYPGVSALGMMPLPDRLKFASLFPDFAARAGPPVPPSRIYGPTARPFLARRTVRDTLRAAA